MICHLLGEILNCGKIVFIRTDINVYFTINAKLVHYVLVQHSPSSGSKCKYSKTYDLNSQKHLMRVITITDLNKRTMASNRTKLCKTVTMLNKKKQEKMKGKLCK